MLYDSYNLAVTDATGIMTEYCENNQFTISNQHCIDFKINESSEIPNSIISKDPLANVVIDGNLYINVDGKNTYINQLGIIKGWAPKSL